MKIIHTPLTIYDANSTEPRAALSPSTGHHEATCCSLEAAQVEHQEPADTDQIPITPMLSTHSQYFLGSTRTMHNYSPRNIFLSIDVINTNQDGLTRINCT